MEKQPAGALDQTVVDQWDGFYWIGDPEFIWNPKDEPQTSNPSGGNTK